MKNSKTHNFFHNIVENVFTKLLNTAEQIGLFGDFFRKVIIGIFQRPFELKEVWKQCYLIGYKSLPLVGITGFIMGVVLTLQSKPTLAEFGAESWLPAMVSVSIVREIGPVITGLICAGKVGSGIGAELSSMNVTEQIDAMEVSGSNPFKYLAITRILACTFMLPILTIYSDLISLFGSFVGVNISGNVSWFLYFNQSVMELQFLDLIPALTKTIFFGFSIGLISTYMGYNSGKGTVGVGVAANSSVVISSLLIFVIDIFAVQITSLFM